MMKPVRLALSILPALLLVSPTPAAAEPSEELPPIGVWRPAGIFAVSAATGGIVGGAIGALSYYTFRSGEQDEISGAVGFIAGGLIGYTAGSAVGAHRFGSIGEETGSFKTTLAGSVVGVAVGGLAFLANERWFGNSNDGRNDRLNGAILLSGPPLGATIAFLMTRRIDRSGQAIDGALLNFDGEKVWIGSPAVAVHADRSEVPVITERIHLVRVLF